MHTDSFQLGENTIKQIQQQMEAGNLSAKQLTLLYLKQIANYNQDGPQINAIVEVNPDALHIAEALDVERKKDGARGPLHGIPVIVKDNIDTADKTHTTAGSVALQHHYATEDAFIVKQLRDAGAIILGKANLTEWANFMTEGMPNGYSSRGGQVLNPYGPGKFDVGGSSAGTGAGIAANFAVGGIGTETSGSILSPASSNSLVGIKPTVGLLSRTGIIPISNSQDTAGPMTRTVEDAAILLGVLSGIDEKDPATKMNPIVIQDYTSYLNKDGAKNTRIGIPRNYLTNLTDEETALFNQAVKDLEALGATIVDSIELNNTPKSSVMFHEFKNGVNAYLKNSPGSSPVHSLLDVINYNQAHPKEALQFDQTLLLASEKKSGTLTEAEYLRDRIQDLAQSQENGIDKIIDDHELDALLFANNLGAGIAAKPGYPSITVPGGYTSEGKPIGITFTSKAFSEATLIEMAYAYEKKTLHRKAPTL
ncbi:amidase family protein [Oceanobacillus halotolerans]|uniref:amidase family protein n=1 Tax=Oceanobacillus halotolerans TaxID=2663380 RepID=UPI0013D9185F|nr:amidase family protein [Oceanobacillus halotolerans]